jgi:hypothetical protein
MTLPNPKALQTRLFHLQRAANLEVCIFME